MVIECADPATCQAIAQQMRELITYAIWVTMILVIGVAAVVELWHQRVSDTDDT